MVGMGFTMGKGVYSDVISELFAGSVLELRTLRENLEDPTQAFSDWGLIDLIGEAPSLEPWRNTHYKGAGGLAKGDWKLFAETHFREDWFASHEWQGPQQVVGVPDVITPTQYQKLTHQERLAYKERSTTGHWMGWGGDAEAIVREGLIRTIDACLGEDHRDPGSGESSPRQLAVEFKWVCGGQRFDWWVSWDAGTAYRPVPDESQVPSDKAGRVVVTLLTPGMDGDPLLADWYQDPPGSPHAPDPRLREYHLLYADPARTTGPQADPPPMEAPRGQVVVGEPVVRVALKSSSRTLQPMGKIAVPPQAINMSMASHRNQLQDEAQMGVANVITRDDSEGNQGRPAIAVVSPSPGELGLFDSRTN